jgi:hypothetical protein
MWLWSWFWVSLLCAGIQQQMSVVHKVHYESSETWTWVIGVNKFGCLTSWNSFLKLYMQFNNSLVVWWMYLSLLQPCSHHGIWERACLYVMIIYHNRLRTNENHPLELWNMIYRLVPYPWYIMGGLPIWAFFSDICH